MNDPDQFRELPPAGFEPGSSPWSTEKIKVLVFLVVMGFVVAVALYVRHWSLSTNGLAASGSRVTAGGDAKDRSSIFEKASRPEIWFRVTLRDPPRYWPLPLACEWTDPSGQVAHRNSWRTRPIRHDLWETHCRCSIGESSPLGQWSVRMTYDGRPLAVTTFEVR